MNNETELITLWKEELFDIICDTMKDKEKIKEWCDEYFDDFWQVCYLHFFLSDEPDEVLN